jgi:RHS repeat-associated protein
MLDNFGARYDTSNLGRFMTPDWAAKPVTVPYAHFGNPQTLNLYSYVDNNPTTLGDPDGHVPWGWGGFAGGCEGTAEQCQQNKQQQWGQEFLANAQKAAAQNQDKSKTEQKLKFKTLKGGAHSKTWVGQWQLSEKSKKGGWIVQTVVNLDAAGKETRPQFWEAWEVKPNSQYTKYYPDPEDDTFSGFPSGHTAQAEARFYEGLTLPSSFKANNPDTPSGILPSTTVNPNLPTANATAPVDRVWDVP